MNLFILKGNMKRILYFLIFLFGILWWIWPMTLLGIWNHDEDYPKWITNIIYKALGIDGKQNI